VEWDWSVYPDREPPDLDAADCPDWERADYVHRFCSAVDYGVVPTGAMIRAMDGPVWRRVLEQFPVANSPFYHALRLRHDLPEIPYPPFLDLNIGSSNLTRREDWRQDDTVI
jgi:hypothetical protein